MSSREEAIEVIDRLHAAQAHLYTEGEPAAVRALLSDQIAWHVPGTSPIAGSYHGRDEVIEYMLARGQLADGTFRIHRLDVLTGKGETIAVLTDGEATIDGADRRWSTVGLYRLEGGQVAECWLLPLDQAEFDDIWTPPTPPDHLHSEPRRGGRVVECTGLENRRRGNSSAGSNPAPSAPFYRHLQVRQRLGRSPRRPVPLTNVLVGQRMGQQEQVRAFLSHDYQPLSPR